MGYVAPLMSALALLAGCLIPIWPRVMRRTAGVYVTLLGISILVAALSRWTGPFRWFYLIFLWMGVLALLAGLFIFFKADVPSAFVAIVAIVGSLFLSFIRIPGYIPVAAVVAVAAAPRVSHYILGAYLITIGVIGLAPYM